MFDSGYEAIPPGLDEMTPGPALAQVLSLVDVDRVSPHDRVVVLRAQMRMASHRQAQVFAAIAAISDSLEAHFPDDPDLGWEAAATEIGAALRLTRRSAERELDSAVAVRRRLPRLWEAMAAGEVDARRAIVVVHGTEHLDEATARMVVDVVIGDASRLTTGELRARVRRLCIEADPDSAQDEYHRSVEDRRVIVEANPEGTANLLGLNLPPERVAAISRMIDRYAKTLSRAGDPRSIDQLRADVYLDLLGGKYGREPAGGMVDLHVDLATLAELSEAPGELAGYGPVIADIARQIAERQAAGEWRYTIFDPDTGLPITDGTTRRRPTAADRRAVEAREHVCYFPGCRMPATQCDLDHRTPWSQLQRTSAAGLDPGCKHHHLTVRHAIGWKHRILPNGDHLWTSPLGHQYTKSGLPP